MPHSQRPDVDVDVLIIGAGLSGIGAACQLTQRSPDTTYRILESRADLGGTWDLFRYPGMRIQYGHRVVAARRSSAHARWTVDVEVGSIDSVAGTSATQLTCGFLWINTGYYHYDHCHTPDIDGLDTFGGSVIHPQPWPESFEVTQLQRTPTYVATRPTIDRLASRLAGRIPRRLAQRLVRAKYIRAAQSISDAEPRRPVSVAGRRPLRDRPGGDEILAGRSPRPGLQ